MATIISKVNFLHPNDVERATKQNMPIDQLRKRPGYFVKWTKFIRKEEAGEFNMSTEIEMAIIADAETGQTYPVKSVDFQIELLNFIEINKIDKW